MIVWSVTTCVATVFLGRQLGEIHLVWNREPPCKEYGRRAIAPAANSTRTRVSSSALGWRAAEAHWIYPWCHQENGGALCCGGATKAGCQDDGASGRDRRRARN